MVILLISDLALFLQVEDLYLISFAFLQEGVSTFELNKDLLSSGVAEMVFELNFSVNAIIGRAGGAEYLTSFSARKPPDL